MTNYTPDTGEVRNAYGSHVGYCHRATKDGLAEFDRWYADEIRKAKTEALYEAADAWHEENVGTSPRAYKWLWDRAQQLTEES